MTGLWQVSGRSNLCWDDAVRFDPYYVENWSLAMDLTIIAKTIYEDDIHGATEEWSLLISVSNRAFTRSAGKTLKQCDKVHLRRGQPRAS